MSDTRAAFEAWLDEREDGISRRMSLGSGSIARAWEAWQAATAAQVERVEKLRAALTVFADMQPHHAPRGHSSTVWAEKLHAARTALKETGEQS